MLQSKPSPSVLPDVSSDPPNAKRHSSNQKWYEKLERFRVDQLRSMQAAVHRADLSLQQISTRVQRVKSQRLESSKMREESNRYRLEVVKSHLQKQAEIADSEIVDKLKRYRARMERSERYHEQQLRTRAQTTAKRRQRMEQFRSAEERQNEEENRLMEFVRKQKARGQKAELSKEEQNKSMEEQRKQREEKWNRFERNRREQISLKEKRAREIEKKHADNASAIATRNLSIMKDTFYKQEQHRSREESAQHNLAKLKRIQSARQTQIYNHSIEEAKRVEMMKLYRRQIQAKYESALHSSLIERDRTYELVEIIARSPNTKKAQKLVKELGTE